MSRFDIRKYLKNRKAIIDRALDRSLKDCKQQPHILYDAMRYGVFPGGKRLRPILTLASGELFGGQPKIILSFACAIELIHNYSIIHDDLPALDNDDLRRGQPSNHKVFGEGIALLAGDALLTEAFHLMTTPTVLRALEPNLVARLIHEVSHAAGIAGLVGGQALDLQAEGREVDIATVEYMHVRKTGALILVAARVGAQIGGSTPRELRRVTRYGEFLGLAFQIVDDILDAQGQSSDGDPKKALGKERRKATYPSVVGLAAAKTRARELLQSCLQEVEIFGKGAEPLRGIARAIVDQTS